MFFEKVFKKIYIRSKIYSKSFRGNPSRFASCDLLSIYMYARSIEGMRRREKKVKRWFGVERGEGFFDPITVISVELILHQSFGVSFYEGRIICGDRIKLQRRFSLCSLAKRRREFSSGVSRKFYNTFVLVSVVILCNR